MWTWCPERDKTSLRHPWKRLRGFFGDNRILLSDMVRITHSGRVKWLVSGEGGFFFFVPRMTCLYMGVHVFALQVCVWTRARWCMFCVLPAECTWKLFGDKTEAAGDYLGQCSMHANLCTHACICVRAYVWKCEVCKPSFICAYAEVLK